MGFRKQKVLGSEIIQNLAPFIVDMAFEIKKGIIILQLKSDDSFCCFTFR